MMDERDCLGCGTCEACVAQSREHHIEVLEDEVLAWRRRWAAMRKLLSVRRSSRDAQTYMDRFEREWPLEAAPRAGEGNR